MEAFFKFLNLEFFHLQQIGILPFGAINLLLLKGQLHFEFVILA